MDVRKRATIASLAMSRAGHRETCDVPGATWINDLRQRDCQSARWAMLINQDLRRQQFTDGVECPEKCPWHRRTQAR